MSTIIKKTPFIFENGQVYYFKVVTNGSYPDLYVYEKKSVFWKKFSYYSKINSKPTSINANVRTSEIKAVINNILSPRILTDWDGFVGDISYDAKERFREKINLNKL